jgi:hypothetical protein
VNVVIVSHEKIPFILGTLKEFLNSSRFKIYGFGHLKDWDFIVKLMSSLLCFVKVWGVPFAYVKVVVVSPMVELLCL